MPIRGVKVYELQPMATHNGALTQNEYEYVLGAGSTAGVTTAWEDNVRLRYIGVGVETTNETLQVLINVDGVDITGDGSACTAGQNNFVIERIYCDGATLSHHNRIVLNTYNGQLLDLEGRRVAVAYRKSTNAGADDQTCIVVYDKWGMI